jgi:hypothetical protein
MGARLKKIQSVGREGENKLIAARHPTEDPERCHIGTEKVTGADYYEFTFRMTGQLHS